jgi:hypothetical protein
MFTNVSEELSDSIFTLWHSASELLGLCPHLVHFSYRSFLLSISGSYLSIYESTDLCWTLEAVSVNLFTESVGHLGRGGVSSSQGRYLHTGQHKQNTRTQTSIPEVGLEPTIPVYELAKTVHASDSAATVIGISGFCCKWQYGRHL